MYVNLSIKSSTKIVALNKTHAVDVNTLELKVTFRHINLNPKYIQIIQIASCDMKERGFLPRLKVWPRRDAWDVSRWYRRGLYAPREQCCPSDELITVKNADSEIISGTESRRGREGGAPLDLRYRKQPPLFLSNKHIPTRTLQEEKKKIRQGDALKIRSGREKSKLITENQFTNLSRENKR